MTRFQPSRSSMIAIFLGLGLSSGVALAQGAALLPSATVRCDTYPTRSRASVDGHNLAAGAYTSQVTSGGVTVGSPVQNAVNGEAQWDFDSKRDEILAGATRIPKTFIVNDQVTGAVLDSTGHVVASATVACLVH